LRPNENMEKAVYSSTIVCTVNSYGKTCKEFFLQTLLPASLCHLLNAVSGSRIKGYTEENL